MPETAVVEHAAEAAHTSGIHVALSAEQIGTIFGIPLTNTLLMSWIVMVLLFIFAIVVRSKLSLIPGKFQTFVELLFGYVYDFIETTLEDSTWALARICCFALRASRAPGAAHVPAPSPVPASFARARSWSSSDPKEQWALRALHQPRL
jgi:hypothetical protein